MSHSEVIELGAQSHSIAFGGVFPNINEAILADENITQKIRILMDSLKLFCYCCGMATKKIRMVQLQLEDRDFTSSTHIMYAQYNPLSGFWK